MIELRNVEKFYETGAGKTFVLRRISLDIKQGDFVTIMGPSGAGKSTLLAILGMLDSNWQGEFYFLSDPVHKMKLVDVVPDAWLTRRPRRRWLNAFPFVRSKPLKTVGRWRAVAHWR